MEQCVSQARPVDTEACHCFPKLLRESEAKACRAPGPGEIWPCRITHAQHCQTRTHTHTHTHTHTYTGMQSQLRAHACRHTMPIKNLRRHTQFSRGKREGCDSKPRDRDKGKCNPAPLCYLLHYTLNVCVRIGALHPCPFQCMFT